MASRSVLLGIVPVCSAHTAGHLPAIDDRDALAELRRRDRPLLPRGAAADDDEIVIVRSHLARGRVNRFVREVASGARPATAVPAPRATRNSLRRCLLPALPPGLGRYGGRRASLEHRRMPGHDALGYGVFRLAGQDLEGRVALGVAGHPKPPPHLLLAASASFGGADIGSAFVLELETLDALRMILRFPEAPERRQIV